MSVELTRKNEGTTKWYPVQVSEWDEFLAKKIFYGCGYRNVYAMRRNIAYNLQCLQYLDQTLLDLNLSQTVLTQTYKLFILVTGGIVETLLFFLLKSENEYNQTYWKKGRKYKSNATKGIDGKLRKVETQIYIKLEKKRDSEMNFDAMIKKVRAKKLLGNRNKIYSYLTDLRSKRNKIHLHLIDHATDTDWNNFYPADLEKSKYILLHMFKVIFQPSQQEKRFLNFLKPSTSK
jgi:hypothetical protein